MQFRIRELYGDSTAAEYHNQCDINCSEEVESKNHFVINNLIHEFMALKMCKNGDLTAVK